MRRLVGAQFCAGGVMVVSITGCGGMPASNAPGGSCSSSSSISGACNDLSDIGSLVTSTCAVGLVPMGAGGVLGDGTYVLTAVVGYDCGDAGPPPQSQTAFVSGGCLQGVGSVAGQQVTTTQSFVVSGNQLTGSLVCPPGQTGMQTATFTASASSLTLFHPSPFNQVEVYLRR